MDAAMDTTRSPAATRYTPRHLSALALSVALASPAYAAPEVSALKQLSLEDLMNVEVYI